MIVVDTNVLISALIKDSVTRRIIVQSDLTLMYPEHLLKEVGKYEDYILKKTRYTRKEYETMLNTLLDHLTLIPLEVIKPYLPRAKKIIGVVDVNDVAFVAAALAVNSSVWSDDSDFDKQRVVNVLKTKDVMNLVFK